TFTRVREAVEGEVVDEEPVSAR
ncbi:MAG: hypothetical protein JWM97_2856, partial [Phycisphaerales bacterium]|nr:hypothetical protein [Phycisphaerales bacterium]